MPAPHRKGLVLVGLLTLTPPVGVWVAGRWPNSTLAERVNAGMVEWNRAEKVLGWRDDPTATTIADQTGRSAGTVVCRIEWSRTESHVLLTVGHPQAVAANVDGDQADEVVLWDPESRALTVVDGPTVTDGPTVGLPGDVLVAGDFDGNGTEELRLFRPTTSEWLDAAGALTAFGAPFTQPIPLAFDYNADGADEMAVFDQDSGILRSQVPSGLEELQLGQPGDVPLTGHFFAEIPNDVFAAYRPADGSVWVVMEPAPRASTNPNAMPLVGDVDGDGVADVGVFVPSELTVRFSTVAPIALGRSGDAVQMADLDGDGRSEPFATRPC